MNMHSIYRFVLLSFLLLLLFQYPQMIQTVSLSRVCGQFGHKCFGGNWGKRELPKDLQTEIDNQVLENLRLELFQQRLRQLFELD